MAISQNFPNTPPALLLDFAKSKKLDSRITFTRGSTGTYVDDNGLIRTAGINEPRFDHDPNTLKSLGLLIEESRTNLQTYSGIPSANWPTNASPTVTNNAAVSPDGTTNATQISTSNLTGGVYQFPGTLTSGTTYTYSLFVKAVSGSNTIYFGSDGGTLSLLDVNTSTGVATIRSGSPTNITSIAYPNGWYRISFTFTATTTANHSFVIYNTTANANTWLAWGAQVEVGAFATSYIPTVASTVTRSTDNASITGTNFSNWYNQTEGTYVCISKYAQVNPTNQTAWSMYNGSTGAIRQMFNGGAGAEQDRGLMQNEVPAGTYSVNINSGIVANRNNIVKIACAFKTDDFAISQDGFSASTDTSGTLSNHVILYLGNTLPNFWYINGSILQLIYYPRRLSNTYLQELTR